MNSRGKAAADKAAAQLDREGLCWVQMDPVLDADARAACQMRILSILYGDLFDRMTAASLNFLKKRMIDSDRDAVDDCLKDAILDFIYGRDPGKTAGVGELGLYDKSKSDETGLSDFLFMRIPRRVFDRFKREAGNTEGGKWHRFPLKSLDDMQENENVLDAAMYGMQGSQDTQAEDTAMISSGFFPDICSMIWNMTEHADGAASSNTARWRRIFFTETMTLAFKTGDYRIPHERDVFRTMLLPYLDFYMADICRSGKELEETPLKPYCEIVPEQAGKTEVPLPPFPADISLAYLKQVEGITAGASARSMQFSKFKTDVKKL